MNKKLISFCLYGSKPMYLNGAIENVRLATILFPDFFCRFYIDSTVPFAFVETLKHFQNVEIIDMSDSDLPKMTWRFLPADDPDVSVFLSRDADSRLTKREKWVIDDWLKDGKSFLLIKDHPIYYKSFAMMGGLWGMKKNSPIFGIKNLIDAWWKAQNKDELEIYNDDQYFLSNILYPLILSDLSYYDDYNLNQLPFCKMIQMKRKNFHFIGEAFDAENKRLGHYKELRNYYLKKWGLPGQLLVKFLYKINL